PNGAVYLATLKREGDSGGVWAVGLSACAGQRWGGCGSLDAPCRVTNRYSAADDGESISRWLVERSQTLANGHDAHVGWNAYRVRSLDQLSCDGVRVGVGEGRALWRWRRGR